MFPIYEFRPLNIRSGAEVRRYANGKWLKDDGEYDLAFTEIGAGPPMYYYVMLSYRPNILWSWAKHGHWAGHVSRHPAGNAWHYQLKKGKKEWGRNWERDNHPNIVAGTSGMAFVSEAVKCANGAGPQFHIGDPYILAGQLRERDKKRIVQFPKKFICMYCGEVNIWADKRLMTGFIKQP